MRKIAITFLALGFVAFAVPSAQATVLVSEGFNYSDGGLVPNGGWANYSGANFDIQVVSGKAVGSGPNADDDHILFAAQPITDKTYACFQATIPAIAGPPKAIYFAELKDGGAAALVSRVYVLPIDGGWTFGISHSSTNSTNGVTPWSATTLSYDTPYQIVINYDPVAKSSTLWVDPVGEASPSVTNTNAAVAALAVSGFGLRQSASASTLPPVPSYAGTTDWGFIVDNLGVGTTFDDACFQLATPAQSSTWGRVKTLYR